MENSYHIRMSLFPNLNSDRHSDSVISFRLKVEYNLRTESRCFSTRKGQTTQKILHRQWNQTCGLKNKILHCFKRHHCEKLCCERTSQFYICVYIQCRRRRPTILSFFFPAETDVLVPVFSQSTDVVVNTVVVLKFPNDISRTA